MQIAKPELKLFLEQKYLQYNSLDFIATDPISIPHKFSKKEDIEIAAFIAATIAWGQRTTIINNGNKLMEWMDNAPHDFILNCKTNDLKKFKEFKHRTFNGTDLIFFLKSLINIYSNYNGLQSAFTLKSLKGMDNTDILKNSLVQFRDLFFSIDYPHRTQKHISNPTENSAAKRLCMFLRWMVRNDRRGVDFGIWNNVQLNEQHLMCPLDVHSGNIARKLGLLIRQQNDWKAVEELTSNLRKFDEYDPVKYDFALFGLGAFEKF
jgi:uncharacterized protein (TIGR02757 family)